MMSYVKIPAMEFLPAIPVTGYAPKNVGHIQLTYAHDPFH